MDLFVLHGKKVSNVLLLTGDFGLNLRNLIIRNYKLIFTLNLSCKLQFKIINLKLFIISKYLKHHLPVLMIYELSKNLENILFYGHLIA